ncbi:NUDIX domain-containing protein [Oerskovia sp. NPDC057915]|uniref:NUDIX domain-containing protein n=1 Tax=Oerskovia sp. NPDC057915 TaxID=3346280 RepID=UPI0036DC60D3
MIPAAYVLLRRGDQVLLQLRQNTGYMDGHWAAAAAGHVEQGESVLAAARREAREELGIDVAATDLEPVTVMHRTRPDGGPIEQRVDFFFVCRTWTGDPVIEEREKAADLRWFALSALPEPLVPHEAAVLAGLARGVVPAVMTYGFGATEGT